LTVPGDSLAPPADPGFHRTLGSRSVDGTHSLRTASATDEARGATRGVDRGAAGPGARGSTDGGRHHRQPTGPV